MAEWKIIYNILNIPDNKDPNAWEVLGVDRNETDLRKILSAFEERKRVLAAGVVGQRQNVLVRKFQQEVLVPAFNKVCTEAEREEIEDIIEPAIEENIPEEDKEVPALKDDYDTNVYNLSSASSSGEYINADEFLKAEKTKKEDDDPTIPYLEVEEESEYGIVEEDEVDSKGGSTGHEVPVLLDADQFVPELESSQELQALQNEMDDSRAENELDSYEENELYIEEEPQAEKAVSKKKMGREKYLLYFVAIVPFIALGIFAIVLFNIQPQETASSGTVEIEQGADDIGLEVDGGGDESEEKGPDDSQVSESLEARPVEAAGLASGGMKLSLGLEPVEVPIRFSFLTDEVKMSFSDGTSSVEILEDIAVILKAWQFIVQNAPDAGDYVVMLQNQRHRGRSYEVFDLGSESLTYLDTILSEPDSSIEFPVEFFQDEFNSVEKDRVWRAIELAGISGSTTLQEFIFRDLKQQKDQELASRMIRALCIWSSASDQMTMLDLVKPGRRDISRKIFSNLLVRYDIDPLSSGAYESLLPNRFTSRDQAKTLEWWQNNLLRMSPAMGINSNFGNVGAVRSGQAGGSLVSETSYQATSLAVVWKNAIELSAALRSTRGMPLLAPDIEINTTQTYPVNQVLFRSVKQVAEGLLAVMYDDFSQESFLEDLDILRFHALEYEFGDIEKRASYKAEEVSVYCDLIAGGEFSGQFGDALFPKADSPLLQVRQSLFEAMSKYAASPIAKYNTEFIGDISYNISLDFDFELNNEYQLVNESEEKLKQLLEEFRSERFSAEKFNEVRAASYEADMQGKAGLAYLQLGVKALSSDLDNGGAMAIDCFRNAMKWPESNSIIRKHMSGLYDSLSQNPDYHCSLCGNTGYRICSECDGMIFSRCQECRGNGAVTVRLEGRITCPDCGGYGLVPCWECSGTGVVACMECYDYLTSRELFLPNEELLKEIQQEINLSTLQIRVEVGMEY